MLQNLSNRVPQRSRWQGFRSNCSAEIFSKYLITGRCPMIPHASTAHHAGKSNCLLHARLLACKHIYSPHVSCRILSNRVPQRSRWQGFRSKCSAEIFSRCLITGRCPHNPKCRHYPPCTQIQLPVSCSFVGLQRYAQPTCFLQNLSNRVPQRSRWQGFRSKCSAEIFSRCLITGRRPHHPECKHCPPCTQIQLPVACSLAGMQTY